MKKKSPIRKPYSITVTRHRFSKRLLFWGMDFGHTIGLDVESILKRNNNAPITGKGEISLALDTVTRPRSKDGVHGFVWKFGGEVSTAYGAIAHIRGLTGRRFKATFSKRTKRGAVTVF